MASASGIRLEHGTQHRSTAIERLDALQIALDEIARCELAAREGRLPFGARRRDEGAPAERALEVVSLRFG